ncbi:hypothetical protein AB0I95_15055 [Micromonospora sp. NPDC049751]|uniref:hypothetical protein n=1 Tax=Micromonospora sp. NPDC049751 TaxID=3154837 RepID=UPI0033D8AFB2
MIDIEQARELLKKAVDTQGREFVYNPGGGGACKYGPVPGHTGPQGTTGCLVGVALSLNGEERHLEDRHDLTVMALAGVLSDLMSEYAARYFRVAQDVQDDGKTWGEAYDRAEELYRRSLAQ